MQQIENFIYAKEDLNRCFNCSEDYPIRIKTDMQWKLTDDEGIFFLTCYNNKMSENFVLAKKNGEPQIYNSNGYTMLVIIDCVKICIVLNNEHKI